MNRIRDELRRRARRPVAVELDDRHADAGESPLEQAIGREDLERYEAALARLDARDREAIVARLELQQSYEEIALALGLHEKSVRVMLFRSRGKAAAILKARGFRPEASR